MSKNLSHRIDLAYPKFALGVVLLIIFSVLTIAVVTEKTLAFDYWFETGLVSRLGEGFHEAFDVITLLGNPEGLAAIVLVCLVIFSWWRTIWIISLLLLATGGGLVLTWGLKNVFGRMRPGVLPDSNEFSYPSGHTVLATCVLGALIYIGFVSFKSRGRQILWCVSLSLLIAAIGVSRVYLELHYPTDVLAGFLVSISYLIILSEIFRRARKTP